MSEHENYGAGSQSALRQRNVAAVVAALQGGGGLSQAEIARRTGLSAGSVHSIVHDLKRAGRITLTESSRPRISLATPFGHVVGVDAGRRHVRLVLGDLSGDIVAESLLTTGAEAGAAAVVDATRGWLRGLSGSVPELSLRGACVGIPGPVNPRTGEMVAPALLPEWAGVDVVSVFSEALELPVIAENDANLGAIAEARDLDAEAVVYIKAGTGIGAGIVLDGRLRRGASNSAGEIGHLSLDPNGAVCRCGNRGCLETIASVPAILSALESRMLPSHPGIDAVVESALAGDVACVRVLADAGTALGMAAAILCTVLNPDHIVVGGAITRAGDILLRTLGDAMRRYAVPASGNRARITTSAHGDRATAVGALMLAKQVFVEAEHSGSEVSVA